MRLKEWDYYLISNGHIAVALTIADNSYMGLDSISFCGWTRRKKRQSVKCSSLQEERRIYLLHLLQEM